jgi:hypothetical protein
MPPFVQLHGGNGHVLVGLRSVEVDSAVAYQGHRPVPLLDQGDGEEVPLELEVRFNPQEPLTQLDEGRDLLDPIQIEVLQLNLVVMEEPPEEGMRGHPKPALMEVREGDNVAIARRWYLFTAR